MDGMPGTSTRDYVGEAGEHVEISRGFSAAMLSGTRRAVVVPALVH